MRSRRKPPVRRPAQHEPTAAALAVEYGALSHYQDTAEYTRRYWARTEDVAYYVRQAKRCRGSVLEYGCGNGRITLALARAGVHVAGVDRSKAMLEDLGRSLARETRDVQRRVQARWGDMRSLRLRRRFCLVIAPFSTVSHLYTDEDWQRFLARVRAHLVDQGSLVFDFEMPGPQLISDRAGSQYDPIEQIYSTVMDDTGPEPIILTQRIFFPAEMKMLLEHNGFARVRARSDFSSARLSQETSSIVMSCVKAR